MSVAATRVDRSPDTGSLVVCTCGYAVGPFMDPKRATAVARGHRAIHARDRTNERQRERRARRGD